MIAICIIIALICANTWADVSHLVPGNNQFNGYNYDPPSNPLPLPTTFRPEIIINKGFTCSTSRKCFLLQINNLKKKQNTFNSNHLALGHSSSVYLPPSSPDYPLVPPEQDEFDNGYLPPFNEELPTTSATTESNDIYLPPIMVWHHTFYP